MLMRGKQDSMKKLGYAALRLAQATVVFIVVAGTIPAACEEAHTNAGSSSPEQQAAPDAQASPSIPPWFVFFALVNVYPKMESERLVSIYDNAMRIAAPGYDDAMTVGDLRDLHLLWAPHFGLGRNLSNHWALFVQTGYTGGKVRTKEDDRSIFAGLPLHTDFEIKRTALYAGIGLDYFPFGMPVLQHYDSWGERLCAAKPVLGGRATWTYATYRARARTSIKPFDSMRHLGVELSDEWLIPSFNGNIGVDVPVNEHSALSFNAGYTWFNRRDYDFNASAFTIGFKHYFR